MDPLSVTASIIAVLTLTGTIGATIKALTRDAKGAPTELIEINKEVESLAWVLQRLQIFVDEERQPNSRTKALATYSSTYDIDVALSACRTTMGEIEAKVAYIESLVTGRPLDKVKYPFSWSSAKKDLRDLRSRLEYSKTLILLSLQLRTLEIMKAASNVSANDGIIRELVYEIQALRAQQQSRRDAGRSSWGAEGPMRDENPAWQLYRPSIQFAEAEDLFGSIYPQDAYYGGYSLLPQPDASRSGYPHIDWNLVFQPDVTNSGFSPINTSDEHVSISSSQQRDDMSKHQRRAAIPAETDPAIHEIETHSSIGTWLSTFRVGTVFQESHVANQESPVVLFDH